MPPLTAAMARTAGIPIHQLRTGRYRQLFRGVFVPRDEPLTIELWVEAARLVLPPDAVATGLTALQLGGLDLGQPLPLHFASTSDRQCLRSGIRLVRRRALDAVAGVVVSREAAAEATRGIGLLDAVCIIDRAIHRRLLTLRDLAWLRSHPTLSARRAGLLARHGAESVRETRLRLCLTQAGLPEPELQVNLTDDNGEWLGRYDMCITEYRLLIEYEGDQHRTDRRQWSRDITRADQARRLGYEIVRGTADLFRDPWSQVLRIDAALRSRGHQGPAPDRSTVWEEMFGELRRPSLFDEPPGFTDPWIAA